MSPRNHFSQRGGPYFINDGFSKHHDHTHTYSVSLMNRLKSLLPFFPALLKTDHPNSHLSGGDQTKPNKPPIV